MVKINETERMLIDDMASFSKDPYKFVLYSFQWGVGELKDRKIEDWQKDILCSLRDGLIDYLEAIRKATASGHGVGKSALVAWIILWGLSTFEDTRIIVTANTETQLKTKTWAELSKWYRMFIARHWFTFTATALYSSDPNHEKTWRADMIPWSENKTEAFAGMHNKGKRIILIFDEASAISDNIWEVSEGALTDQDTEIIWLVFGNPTRNTGRFKECFGKYRHRWDCRQIDSRQVTITDKKQIEKWINDYGENSDFCLVRIKGQFPSASDRQFIGMDLVNAARGKVIEREKYHRHPVIIGVDPAWTGGDETVIFLRQGLYSKRLATYLKNDDDFVIAGYVAKFQDEHNAQAVFIDYGYGTGIVSAGKQMGRNWQLVNFAWASTDPKYLNKRAEMWGLMKDWLREGAGLPDEQQISDDLVAPEYILQTKTGKIVLESKEDIKKRKLPSPNNADALALTFAAPVKVDESNLAVEDEDEDKSIPYFRRR